MAKYDIKEVEGFSDTRVFRVEMTGERARLLDFANVWVHGDRAHCVNCQTPLCGMSGSCAHAKAVKRILKKSAPPV